MSSILPPGLLPLVVMTLSGYVPVQRGALMECLGFTTDTNKAGLLAQGPGSRPSLQQVNAASAARADPEAEADCT